MAPCGTPCTFYRNLYPLRMVTHSMTETYDNDTHFDLTYIVCVWITFLPTVTLPWFYSRWVLIGSLSKLLLVELFTSGSPSSTSQRRVAEQERIFGQHNTSPIINTSHRGTHNSRDRLYLVPNNLPPPVPTHQCTDYKVTNDTKVFLKNNL